MTLGDHIYIYRTGYTHHGIDCGDGTVIHYDGKRICEIPINDFCDGRPYYVKDYVECDSNEVTCQRAKDRLNECEYNLIYNNCEHFACYCKTGVYKSIQVVKFICKLLPQSQIIYQELQGISSQLSRIEFKIDLVQETKLEGSIQGLIDAIDVSDTQLIRQYVKDLEQSHAYYSRYLDSLKSNKLTQGDLPLVKEIFVKYTNLALISNFALYLCYLLLGHKDKAVEISRRFCIGSKLFEYECIPWFRIPTAASYVCHPDGIVAAASFCYDSVLSAPLIPYVYSSNLLATSVGALLLPVSPILSLSTSLIAVDVLNRKKSNEKQEELIQFKFDDSTYLKIRSLFDEFDNYFLALI